MRPIAALGEPPVRVVEAAAQAISDAHFGTIPRDTALILARAAVEAVLIAWAEDDEDFGIPRHPDADKFNPGTWEEAGQCICGQTLPPQKDWGGQPHPWPSITCSACGRCYVDEDDFVAIYDEGCTDGGDESEDTDD